MREHILEWTKTLLIVVILSVMFWVLGAEMAKADVIKVAVIDTGFDFNGTWEDKPTLCKDGHKDFTRTGLNDNNGHGTHIAGVIGKYAQGSKYCLVIIKFYDDKSQLDALQNGIEAIKYASKLGVDIINLSMGGYIPSTLEKQAVLNALNKGIKIVAAAGNEGKSYTKQGYYPALYHKNIIVVGSTNNKGERLPSSNYGKEVDYEVNGKNVYSILPNNKYGYMTGTSQAAAKITGILTTKLNKGK